MLVLCWIPSTEQLVDSGVFVSDSVDVTFVKVMVGWAAVMTSWAARMHRRAATFSNVVTSCGHPSGPYPRRLEKVKFGVPLEEVCKNDIPGPLLVSLFHICLCHTSRFIIYYNYSYFYYIGLFKFFPHNYSFFFVFLIYFYI